MCVQYELWRERLFLIHFLFSFRVLFEFCLSSLPPLSIYFFGCSSLFSRFRSDRRVSFSFLPFISSLSSVEGVRGQRPARRTTTKTSTTTRESRHHYSKRRGVCVNESRVGAKMVILEWEWREFDGVDNSFLTRMWLCVHYLSHTYIPFGSHDSHLIATSKISFSHSQLISPLISALFISFSPRHPDILCLSDCRAILCSLMFSHLMSLTSPLRMRQSSKISSSLIPPSCLLILQCFYAFHWLSCLVISLVFSFEG